MKIKRTTAYIAAIMFMCFICASSASAALPAKASIDTYVSGKQTITVAKSGSAWTAKVGGRQLIVEPKGAGGYVLKAGPLVIAEGKRKDDKLKFRTKDGKFYMALKFKSDKIKVSLKEDDPAPWEIKFKSDKAKVARSDKELGDVKYNKDTKKLKAKNAADATMAETKSIKSQSAVLAPYLMSGLDVQKQEFLMLLLFAMGK